LLSFSATGRLKALNPFSNTPEKSMQTIAEPALTAAIREGFRSRAAAATDQKPACQKQRFPPPEKTMFS